MSVGPISFGEYISQNSTFVYATDNLYVRVTDDASCADTSVSHDISVIRAGLYGLFRFGFQVVCTSYNSTLTFVIVGHTRFFAFMLPYFVIFNGSSVVTVVNVTIH